MDVLTLKGLRYDAPHGYFEEERVEGNTFEVDLVFYADLTKAGQTDDLTQTINYNRAEQLVSGIIKSDSVKLIETLVENIGTKLFDEFKMAQKLKVRVRKLNPSMSTTAKYSQVERQWSR